MKCDILEGECRAVEEFKQVNVLLLVECDGRCDILRAECGVTAVDDVLEVCGGDFGGRDVAGEDLVCELFERVVLPLGRPVVRQGRDLLGNEEAAVGGKTLQYDILERELRWSV